MSGPGVVVSGNNKLRPPSNRTNPNSSQPGDGELLSHVSTPPSSSEVTEYPTDIGGCNNECNLGSEGQK